MCGAANDCDGMVNIVKSVDLMEEACLDFMEMERRSSTYTISHYSLFVLVRSVRMMMMCLFPCGGPVSTWLVRQGVSDTSVSE